MNTKAHHRFMLDSAIASFISLWVNWTIWMMSGSTMPQIFQQRRHCSNPYSSFLLTTFMDTFERCSFSNPKASQWIWKHSFHLYRRLRPESNLLRCWSKKREFSLQFLLKYPKRRASNSTICFQN